MAVAFRRHTLLPLDDCLYALQASIPHLTRSALHRCFQRHGISRLPETEGSKTAKKAFKRWGEEALQAGADLAQGARDRLEGADPADGAVSGP